MRCQLSAIIRQKRVARLRSSGSRCNRRQPSPGDFPRIGCIRTDGSLVQSRRSWEEEWKAPSGRAPRPERPISLKATFATALRGLRPGGKARAQRADGKSRVAPAGADARRVTVKVRIAQVGADWGKKAAKLHLAYIERAGVAIDGSPGTLYGEHGSVSREAFDEELPGEKHQFRVVISPEDADDLNLQEYVRTYMQRVERDLGQKLRWAAVNHHDTDDPHVHVVIRGVDANGAEVRMDRDYVSHGLRHRASELATEELGPRPARSRQQQFKREATLEQYTSLDAVLERRAMDGVVRTDSRDARDPHLESALKKRLEVLRTMGLATGGKGRWKLSPNLRAELQHVRRRTEAVRTIGTVLDVNPDRWRIVDRNEPRHSERKELEHGVQGVLRWKGLDEQGQFCVVIETTSGLAYHLPISGRVAQDARVGQVLDLKRAVDKDLQIEQAAQNRGWSFDLTALPELARGAYRSRLEQLQRMGLATPETADSWRLRPDFRAELAKGKQQPYWQLVALRTDPQRLDAQVTYEGSVWLDRIKLDQLGQGGFGAFGKEVQEALRRRYEYLRGLGLDPRGATLSRDLQVRQRKRLEHSIAARDGVLKIRPTMGLEGTVRIHRESNGARFLEVRSRGHFFVRTATRGDEALDGKRVRVQVGDKGRLQLERIESEQRGLKR
jgi:type IV secretory pathway VirD2 relaxase